MHDLVPSTSSFDTQFNTSGYTPLINRSKTAHAPAMEKNEIMEAVKQNGLTVWQTLFFWWRYHLCDNSTWARPPIQQNKYAKPTTIRPCIFDNLLQTAFTK